MDYSACGAIDVQLSVHWQIFLSLILRSQQHDAQDPMNIELVHTLLAALDHAQSEHVERSLKQIKNLIIGNVTNKNVFLTHHILRK